MLPVRPTAVLEVLCGWPAVFGVDTITPHFPGAVSDSRLYPSAQVRQELAVTSLQNSHVKWQLDDTDASAAAVGTNAVPAMDTAPNTPGRPDSKSSVPSTALPGKPAICTDTDSVARVVWSQRRRTPEPLTESSQTKPAIDSCVADSVSPAATRCKNSDRVLVVKARMLIVAQSVPVDRRDSETTSECATSQPPHADTTKPSLHKPKHVSAPPANTVHLLSAQAVLQWLDGVTEGVGDTNPSPVGVGEREAVTEPDCDNDEE